MPGSAAVTRRQASRGALQRCGQAFALHRFGQVVRGVEVECSQRVFGVRGDEHHRRRLRQRVAARPPARCPLAGHLDVEQHASASYSLSHWRACCAFAHSPATMQRGSGIQSTSVRQARARQGLVVDDEHAQRGSTARSCLVPQAARRGALGSARRPAAPRTARPCRATGAGARARWPAPGHGRGATSAADGVVDGDHDAAQAHASSHPHLASGLGRLDAVAHRVLQQGLQHQRRQPRGVGSRRRAASPGAAARRSAAVRWPDSDVPVRVRCPGSRNHRHPRRRRAQRGTIRPGPRARPRRVPGRYAPERLRC